MLDGIDTSYRIEPYVAYGSTLIVDMSATTGDACILQVAYVVGSSAALEWLQPEQTLGKLKPYLYTQGQACLNRCDQNSPPPEPHSLGGPRGGGETT